MIPNGFFFQMESTESAGQFINDFMEEDQPKADMANNDQNEITYDVDPATIQPADQNLPGATTEVNPEGNYIYLTDNGSQRKCF